MSVELVPLETGQLNARIYRLADHLDHWGDLRVTDDGGNLPRRRVEWFLAAPGEPGVYDQVIGLYREYYDRDGGDWLIFKYTYEYLDKVHGRRLAYHMHRIGGVLTAHAHCGGLDISVVQGVDDDEERDHFRATEVDLLEANHEFMTMYASALPPDCSGLRPLRVDRR